MVVHWARKMVEKLVEPREWTMAVLMVAWKVEMKAVETVAVTVARLVA